MLRVFKRLVEEVPPVTRALSKIPSRELKPDSSKNIKENSSDTFTASSIFDLKERKFDKFTKRCPNASSKSYGVLRSQFEQEEINDCAKRLKKEHPNGTFSLGMIMSEVENGYLEEIKAQRAAKNVAGRNGGIV